MKNKIKSSHKSITINDHYEIEFSRMKTYKDVCQWIFHLSSKSWVDTELIKEFLRLVFIHKKTDIYNETHEDRIKSELEIQIMKAVDDYLLKKEVGF
jgi:hypothetical protein